MDNRHEKNNDFIKDLKKINNDYNQDLKQRLLKEKNSYYVLEFIYDSKTYVQAFKKDSLENIYYEINDEIIEVEDKSLLEHFKELFEAKSQDVVF